MVLLHERQNKIHLRRFLKHVTHKFSYVELWNAFSGEMIICLVVKDISGMGHRKDLKLPGNLFERKMSDLDYSKLSIYLYHDPVTTWK